MSANPHLSKGNAHRNHELKRKARSGALVTQKNRLRRTFQSCGLETATTLNVHYGFGTLFTQLKNRKEKRIFTKNSRPGRKDHPEGINNKRSPFAKEIRCPNCHKIHQPSSQLDSVRFFVGIKEQWHECEECFYIWRS